MEGISNLEFRLGRISEIGLIKSIRQGLLYNMPIIMVGSFSMMLLSMPIPALRQWLSDVFGVAWQALFTSMYKGTFSIMSLSTLLAVSYAILQDNEHARKGNGNGIVVTLCCLSCYVIMQYRSEETLVSELIGPNGIFYAIIIAAVSTKLYIAIYRMLPKKKRVYAYDTDTLLQASIVNILPAFFTIVIAALLRMMMDAFSFQSHAQSLIQTLNGLLSQQESAVATLLIFILLTHVLWFFGIHGTAVMEGVVEDVFTQASEVNAALAAAGQAPTEILTKEFFSLFVIMGGSGCTLALILALFFLGRSSNTRQLARFSVIPACFNINEMLLYGLPIIFNPYYLIPFLLVPLVLSLTSYIAFSTGLVPLTTDAVVWTTPILLSGYLSTGSIAGALLQLLNLAVATLCYMPFVYLSEKNAFLSSRKQLEQATQIYADAQSENLPRLLEQNDGVGSICRELAAQIKNHLDSKESGICIEYQPKTRSDGRVYGAEALLRWHHPVLGYIPPVTTLGIAEEAELTVKLGAWITNEALCQLAAWQREGRMLTLSINLAPKQVKEDTQIVRRVQAVIDKYKIDTRYIEFELTEQSAIDQGMETRLRLEQLRELGVHISIDDFGMGSSSLLYLRDFGADVVKLDMSLVRSMESNKQSQEIVRSIVMLCKQLDAEVVAEGVETPEQIALLESLGCHHFQGWYFSKALSPDGFDAYINEHGTVLGKGRENSNVVCGV